MENSGNGKKRKEERNGLTLTGLLMEGVEEQFCYIRLDFASRYSLDVGTPHKWSEHAKKFWKPSPA